MGPKANLIVDNGQIYLGLEAGFACSLPVFGNRVLAAGDKGAVKFTGSAQEILDTRVDFTILDGEVIYERGS